MTPGPLFNSARGKKLGSFGTSPQTQRAHVPEVVGEGGHGAFCRCWRQRLEVVGPMKPQISFVNSLGQGV